MKHEVIRMDISEPCWQFQSVRHCIIRESHRCVLF